MSLKKWFLKMTKRKDYRMWKRIMTVMGMAVVFVTTYMLILPAITLTDPNCGLEEHVHSDECYSKTLVCSEEENATIPPTFACKENLHSHDSGCYDENGSLICGKADFYIHKHDDSCYFNGELVCPLDEIEEHTHTDDCFTEEQVLICGQEETEGHIHDDSCYSTYDELVCGMEESEDHHHDGSCYVTHSDLICGQEEHEGHTHTDDCYKTVKKLTCDKAQLHTHDDSCYEDGVLVCPLPEVTEHVHSADCMTANGHIHTDECYKEELICGKPEHQHTDDCYNKETSSQDSSQTPSEETNGLIPDMTTTGSTIDSSAVDTEDLVSDPESFFNDLLGAMGGPSESALWADVTPHADIPSAISLDGEEEEPAYKDDLVVEEIAKDGTDRNERTYDELKEQVYTALGYEAEDDFDNNCNKFALIDIYYENDSAYLNESPASIDLHYTVNAPEGESKLHLLTLGADGPVEITPTEVVREGDDLVEYKYEAANLDYPVAIDLVDVSPVYVQQLSISSIHSGTAPFDTTTGDGYDESETDDIVRTFDDVTYQLQPNIQARSDAGQTNYTGSDLKDEPLIVEATLPYDPTVVKFDLSKLNQYNTNSEIAYYKGDVNEDNLVMIEYYQDGQIVKKVSKNGADTSINALVDKTEQSYPGNPYSSGITKQVFKGEYVFPNDGNIYTNSTFNLDVVVSVQSGLDLNGDTYLKPVFKSYFKKNPTNLSNIDPGDTVDTTKTAGEAGASESASSGFETEQIKITSSDKFYTMNIMQNVATKEMGNFNFAESGTNYGNKVTGDIKQGQEVVYGKLLGYGVSLQLNRPKVNSESAGMKGVKLPTGDTKFKFNVTTDDASTISVNDLGAPVYTPDGKTVSSDLDVSEGDADENHNDEIMATAADLSGGLSVEVLEDDETEAAEDTFQTYTAEEVVMYFMDTTNKAKAEPLTKVLYNSINPSSEYEIRTIAGETYDAYIYTTSGATVKTPAGITVKATEYIGEGSNKYFTGFNSNSIANTEGKISIDGVGDITIDKSSTCNSSGRKITITVPTGYTNTATLYISTTNQDATFSGGSISETVAKNSQGKVTGLEAGKTYTLSYGSHNVSLSALVLLFDTSDGGGGSVDPTEPPSESTSEPATESSGGGGGGGSDTPGPQKIVHAIVYAVTNGEGVSNTTYEETPDGSLTKEAFDKLLTHEYTHSTRTVFDSAGKVANSKTEYNSAGNKATIKVENLGTFQNNYRSVLKGGNDFTIDVPTTYGAEAATLYLFAIGNGPSDKNITFTSSDSTKVDDWPTKVGGNESTDYVVFTGLKPGNTYTFASKDDLRVIEAVLVLTASADPTGKYTKGTGDNTVDNWDFTQNMPTDGDADAEVGKKLSGGIVVEGQKATLKAGVGAALELADGGSIKIPVPEGTCNGALNVTFTGGTLTMDNGTELASDTPSVYSVGVDSVIATVIANSAKPDTYITLTASGSAVDITGIKLAYEHPDNGVYGSYSQEGKTITWGFGTDDDMPGQWELAGSAATAGKYALVSGDTLETDLSYTGSKSYFIGGTEPYFNLADGESISIGNIPTNMDSGSITVTFASGNTGSLSVNSEGTISDTTPHKFSGKPEKIELTASGDAQITNITFTYSGPTKGTYGVFTHNDPRRTMTWDFTQDMPEATGGSENTVKLDSSIDEHMAYSGSDGYYSSNNYIVLKENDELTISGTGLSDLTKADLTIEFDGGSLTINDTEATNNTASELTVNGSKGLDNIVIKAGADTQIKKITLSYRKEGDASEAIPNGGVGHVYIADTVDNTIWNPRYFGIGVTNYDASQKKDLIPGVFTLSTDIAVVEKADDGNVSELGQLQTKTSADIKQYTLNITVPKDTDAKGAKFFIRGITAANQNAIFKIEDTSVSSGTAPQKTSSKISENFSNTIVFTGLVPGKTYKLTAIDGSGKQTTFGFSLLALVTYTETTDAEMTAPQDPGKHSPVLWDYAENVSGTHYGKWKRNMNWETLGENTNVAKLAAPFNSGAYIGTDDKQGEPLALKGESAVKKGSKDSEYEEYYGGQWTIEESGNKLITAADVLSSEKTKSYEVTVSGYKFDFDNWHFPTNYAGGATGSTALMDKGMGSTNFFFSSGYFQVLIPFPENTALETAGDKDEANSGKGTVNFNYDITVTASITDVNIGGATVDGFDGNKTSDDKPSHDTDESGEQPNIDGNKDTGTAKDFSVGNIQTMNAIKTRYNPDKDKLDFDFDSNNYPDGSYYISNDGLNSSTKQVAWGRQGDQVDLWGSILLRPASSFSLGAANVLVLFDSKAFEIDTSDKADAGGTIKSIIEAEKKIGYDNASYKILYAYASDDWDSNETGVLEKIYSTNQDDVIADKANDTEAILTYSEDTSMPGKHLVGVLLEVRDVNVPKNTNISVRIPVKVKDTAEVGKVYYMHTSAWAWTYDEDFGNEQAAHEYSWANDDATTKFLTVDPGLASAQTNDVATFRTITGNGVTKNVLAFNRNYGEAKDAATRCKKAEYDTAKHQLNSENIDNIYGMSFLVTGYEAKLEVTDEHADKVYDGNAEIPFKLKGVMADNNKATTSKNTADLSIKLYSSFGGSGAAGDFMNLVSGKDSEGNDGIKIIIGGTEYYIPEGGKEIQITDSEGSYNITVNITKKTRTAAGDTSVDVGNNHYLGEINISSVPVGKTLPDITVPMMPYNGILNGDTATLTATITGDNDQRAVLNKPGDAFLTNLSNVSSDTVTISSVDSYAYPMFVRGTMDNTLRQSDTAFDMFPGGEFQYIIRAANNTGSPMNEICIYDVLPKNSYVGGKPVRLKLKSLVFRTVPADVNGDPIETDSSKFRYPVTNVYLSENTDLDGIKDEWGTYTMNTASPNYPGDLSFTDTNGYIVSSGKGSLDTPIEIGHGTMGEAEQKVTLDDDNNYTAIFAHIGIDDDDAVASGRILQMIITVEPIFDPDGDKTYKNAGECLFVNQGGVVGESGKVDTSVATAAYVTRHISGVVWLDTDQDTVRAALDTDGTSTDDRLEGIPVILYEDRGVDPEDNATRYPGKGKADRYVPATDVFGRPCKTETDINGVYQFDNLAQGNYVVGFEISDTGYTVAPYRTPDDDVNSANFGVTVYGSGATDIPADAVRLEDKAFESYLADEQDIDCAIKYSNTESAEHDTIDLADKANIYAKYKGNSTPSMVGTVDKLRQDVFNMGSALLDQGYSLPETGGSGFAVLSVIGGLCLVVFSVFGLGLKRRYSRK